MRHCYVLRVFTRAGEGGNPLGVVTDTTGLSATTMQTIAARLGFSETIFVDWRKAGMPRVRIFTPAAELPFAGHPLVGAAWLLNTAGPGASRLECGLGPVDLEMTGDISRVTVPARTRRIEPVEAGPLLEGTVGVTSIRAAHRIGMPSPYLLLEVDTPAQVAAARPDMDALEALPDTMGVYLYAGSEAVRARFFAPAVGVPEDPATGSAAVALAALRAWQGAAAGSFDVEQGEEIGRPSHIHCRWEQGAVTIGGTVTRDDLLVLDE